MKKFAVIGHPIEHSKSPTLHQAGFVELEIDATFEKVDIAPESLEQWLKLKVKDYHGLAVTIPHKETLFPFVEKVTDAAQAIGAINTLYWENDVLCGTNTDCVGALKALQSEIPNLQGKKVLVLGAGGASRAIIFALKVAESEIYIWNRTESKAQTLADEFEVDAVENLQALNPDNFDLVINTTSVGLKEWKSLLPASFWTPNHTAFDIVYDPLETKFLSDAADSGAQTITGDLMLVYQALEQFKIWHDQELEPEVMGNAFFEN